MPSAILAAARYTRMGSASCLGPVNQQGSWGNEVRQATGILSLTVIGPAAAEMVGGCKEPE